MLRARHGPSPTSGSPAAGPFPPKTGRGQVAGAVWFDSHGCAGDSIVPGVGMMGQVLAQG